ncbi:hypothetical protein DVH05_015274 [Phytophthora capsici]|nr:hypothetical protein DVH05_015274 [Phytophthora capsici]
MIEAKAVEMQVDLLVVCEPSRGEFGTGNSGGVISGDEVSGGGDVGANDDVSANNDDSDDVPPTQQSCKAAAATERSLRALRDSASVQIKLNERVVPVGRPRLNRKKPRAKAKSDLKEYNQGMKLRGLLRERDVCEVVASLKEIQPGLCEVGRPFRCSEKPLKNRCRGLWIPIMWPTMCAIGSLSRRSIVRLNNYLKHYVGIRQKFKMTVTEKVLGRLRGGN